MYLIVFYVSQPQYVDAVKSLPRPLPLATPAADAHSLENKEGDKMEEVVFCVLFINFHSFDVLHYHFILFYWMVIYFLNTREGTVIIYNFVGS